MSTPPAGFHQAQPQLTVRGAAEAIEFYKSVFGAMEMLRVTVPDSSMILHAQIRIGDSVIMLNDEYPEIFAGGVAVLDYVSPAALGRPVGAVYLYVADVDQTFDLAVQAGSRPEMPPTDMYWGDRYASIVDPYGHRWSLATHVEDVPPAELDARRKAYLAEL